jgi:hypothetical protein
MLRALGPRASVDFARGFATGTMRRKYARWERERAALDDEDAGFEDFVTERVGRAAYETFYAPYAEKVWGLPPRELSQSVAKKRISSTDPLRLFRGLALRVARAIARTPRADVRHYLYPPDGISSIAAAIERRLANLGVAIEYGRSFDPNEAQHANVLYAGNLGDLVSTSLEHRGLYLVYLALPLESWSDVETYYTPSRAHWFGRVSNVGHYAPARKPSGETVLCVEIPEGTWGLGVDFSTGPNLRRLLDQLVHARILPRGADPIEVHQRFVSSVYPLYRRGWLTEWRRAMREIVALETVLPFGRQALFLHCNIDHCVTIAAEAAEHACTGGDVASWIRRAEALLELRVRD